MAGQRKEGRRRNSRYETFDLRVANEKTEDSASPKILTLTLPKNNDPSDRPFSETPGFRSGTITPRRQLAKACTHSRAGYPGSRTSNTERRALPWGRGVHRLKKRSCKFGTRSPTATHQQHAWQGFGERVAVYFPPRCPY